MSGFSLLITTLASQFFIISYANGVEDANLQYDLYILSSYVVAMLMSLGWFQSIGYDKLKLKSLVLFETIFIATEIISFGLSFTSIGNSFAIVKTLGLCAWFYYVLYRNLKVPSAELNDKDIFAVRVVPNDFQGLLLSIIGVYPLGGYGLYYKGSFYHYRKGILVKDSEKLIKARKDKYVVLKAKKHDKETIKAIESQVGSKWSLTKNCFTVIRPLLK